MDGNTVIILLSVVANVSVVAFSYGKLSQKVSDLCRRIRNLEIQVDGITKWMNQQSSK